MKMERTAKKPYVFLAIFSTKIPSKTRDKIYLVFNFVSEYS